MITFHLMPNTTGVTVLISNSGEARPLGEFDSRAVAEVLVSYLRNLEPDQQANLWELAR